MAFTRRSAANALSTLAPTVNSHSIQSPSDTIHVCQSRRIQANANPMTPSVSSTPLGKAPSSNISEHDLSLASPSTDVPEAIIVSTHKSKTDSPGIARGILQHAPFRLAPKPFARMSGSCQNPIVVEETTFPPRPTLRAPKRKHRHGPKEIPEPHQFVAKGYKELYDYGVARLHLAAVPANGSTFTGHQSHDIYRMMHAKLSAAPKFSPNATSERKNPDLPFESQRRLSAPVLTQQHGQPGYQSPYAQHYENPHPMIHYRNTPFQNVNVLRSRAVQYIQHFSGASPHKRRLPDSMPYRNSNNEVEQPSVGDWHPRSRSNLQQCSIVPPYTPQVGAHSLIHQTVYGGTNVHHLIEHTSLITSLLQIYPSFSNQRELQKDILMLVSLQNQHIAEWIKTESQHSPKRKKSNTDSAAILDSRRRQTTTLEMRVENEEDTALRHIFSANAKMWQDGTGNGVADVFAAAPTSSPVARPTQHSQDTGDDATQTKVKKQTSQLGIDSAGFNSTPTTPKRNTLDSKEPSSSKQITPSRPKGTRRVLRIKPPCPRDTSPCNGEEEDGVRTSSNCILRSSLPPGSSSDEE